MRRHGFGDTGTPIRANLPYEANCVIKYADWPVSGTTIVNEGTGGATYNATAVQNDIVTLPSKATAWQFSTTALTDVLSLSTAPVTDNVGAHTMEFLYKYGGAANSELFYKGKGDWTPSYTIGVTNWSGYNFVHIARDDTTASWGAPYLHWIATSTPLLSGNWYDIQITADWSNLTNTPTITINGVVEAIYSESIGVVTAYMNDAGGPMWLGNYVNQYNNFGTLAQYRFHTGILTPARLQQNLLADMWRVGALGP
jgi:hypothetical protein